MLNDTWNVPVSFLYYFDHYHSLQIFSYCNRLICYSSYLCKCFLQNSREETTTETRTTTTTTEETTTLTTTNSTSSVLTAVLRTENPSTLVFSTMLDAHPELPTEVRSTPPATTEPSFLSTALPWSSPSASPACKLMRTTTTMETTITTRTTR
jgi:hypothetical protein